MDTKDGVTPDSEDCSLTREQAELLARLEGLFRELPLSRQRAMIRTLRADDPGGDELPRPEDLPGDGSGGTDPFKPPE
jgi:hypothetical protein